MPLQTAGNRGSSIGTLVFGLRTLSTPACQSRSSNRIASTSAAPKPYVANSNTIAKSRLPGASDREIECRIFCTSFHGRVRGGRSSVRYRGAITPLARSAGKPSCHLQKSEKCPERTAGIRNGSFANAGGKLSHKRIHICQGCPCNGLRSAPQLPEEATCGLDITHQRPLRDAIVDSPVMAILLQ